MTRHSEQNSGHDEHHYVSALRLFRHVDMLAGKIGSRHPGLPLAIAATTEYITGQLRSFGLSVTREVFDAAGSQTCNLVAEIRGHGRPQEIVILGAHYDTTATTPGADDNASAVAVLIEVARQFQSARPRRTIRFVAFSCEESPYFQTDSMGSQFHARNCRARNENVVGMLCLEMVGYYRFEAGSQRIPPSIPRWLHWCFPRRGNFLAAVGNLQSAKLCWSFRRGFKQGTQFPLFSIVLPERIHEIRLSDNSSFWDHGIPALMLTDTSFLRNPNYHQASDTPDTLDYQCMAHVTQGVDAALRKLAGC